MDLFNDPDFEKYRVLEMELGAEVVKSFVVGGKSPEYLAGAMELLRKITNLPSKMISEENESQPEQTEMLKEKALAVLQGNLLKKFLE